MKKFRLVSSVVASALLLTFHCLPGPDFSQAACIPATGCEVALAYFVFNSSVDTNLTSVASRFQATEADILWYSRLNSTYTLLTGQVLYIPFSCQDCTSDQLRHIFRYTVVQNDEDITIASERYQYLTNIDDLDLANGVSDLSFIYPGNILNIPVNCSCGNPSVGTQYGLFATYVAEPNDNLQSLIIKFNISDGLLQAYNPSVTFGLLQPDVDVLFIPVIDGNGQYPPFNRTQFGSKSKAAIIGGSVGAACLVCIIAATVLIYFYIHLPRKRKQNINVEKLSERSQFAHSSVDPSGTPRQLSTEDSTFSNFTTSSPSSGLLNFNADKSVEFSYQELVVATENFSPSKKIGQGGYGSVFYGELRGQKLAIKMMNMQASREFLAELKVLTRVHHTNLVRLIGYCTMGSLFLVYEYVENGTLSQHLKSSRAGSTTLTWPIRIQIALDTARGLEYIHEHTTPTYIHRDIKSSNILLDKSFHAKVADFGLTKLTESSNISSTIASRLVGTFGYMAPEYARFGDVSSKGDVYSFGIVLFEIISAKEAIVHSIEGAKEQSSKGEFSQGLAQLFEDALNDENGKQKLQELVDPALNNEYPLESVWKMANLAKACTREEPQLRPNMRVVVVALMTLFSSTGELNTDQGLENIGSRSR